MAKAYEPKSAYLRVATACPEVSIADTASNVKRIGRLYKEAAANHASLVVFPELCITGYSLGDLVQQTSLLRQAVQGLADLARLTAGQSTVMIAGLPLQMGNRLYNCAAVMAGGEVKGIVPKTYHPNYGEFYDQRWYASWRQPNSTADAAGRAVPFGTDLLFEVAGVLCGVEICEDLWVVRPPSLSLAAKGALLVANPSASPEQIGKAAYRRNLVATHSAKILGAYLYAGCDSSESTSEVVMGGHQLICVNGQILEEKLPFTNRPLSFADIDAEHLAADRRLKHAAALAPAQIIKTGVVRKQKDLLAAVEPNPFLPAESEQAREERLNAALTLQAYGLAMRLRASHIDHLVLGLSGGLDSALALVVSCKAARLLGKSPAEVVHTLTMPGPASSPSTQNNAQRLASEVGVPNTVIPIDGLVRAELQALGHDGKTQDVTYENIQARARTSLLFNFANKHGGLVVGTGDLSEIALGWSTYNADQQSHYNVNASIPKTMVRQLVLHAARQPEYGEAGRTLTAIAGTVISPELTTAGPGKISQSTEDIIGPYELHDFFLYHVIRWGDGPDKIAYLAAKAFAGVYTAPQINSWLGVFLKRFRQSQFKRENMPNGPKVGSVSLSPRGDWRMPPDVPSGALWQ